MGRISSFEYDNGFDARLRGQPITDNPHQPETDAYASWGNGWITSDGLQNRSKEIKLRVDEPVIAAVRRLDNAMGDDPYTNCLELTVGLEDHDGYLWFNLASLIAIARIGAELVLGNETVAKKVAENLRR